MCVCVMNWEIRIDIYTLICIKWNEKKYIINLEERRRKKEREVQIEGIK